MSKEGIYLGYLTIRQAMKKAPSTEGDIFAHV